MLNSFVVSMFDDLVGWGLRGTLVFLVVLSGTVAGAQSKGVSPGSVVPDGIYGRPGAVPSVPAGSFEGGGSERTPQDDWLAGYFADWRRVVSLDQLIAWQKGEQERRVPRLLNWYFSDWFSLVFWNYSPGGLLSGAISRLGSCLPNWGGWRQTLVGRAIAVVPWASLMAATAVSLAWDVGTGVPTVSTRLVVPDVPLYTLAEVEGDLSLVMGDPVLGCSAKAAANQFYRSMQENALHFAIRLGLHYGAEGLAELVSQDTWRGLDAKAKEFFTRVAAALREDSENPGDPKDVGAKMYTKLSELFSGSWIRGACIALFKTWDIALMGLHSPAYFQKIRAAESQLVASDPSVVGFVKYGDTYHFVHRIETDAAAA